ncbi:hypothetical protein Tco_0047222 [Tanacetum coccineum]
MESSRFPSEVGDGGRRNKAILHKLCILDGLLDVLEKGVKLVKILLNLVSSHGWLGLSTQPTPREVDRWFWMGELSLEEMSMKSVRGIFFGGFWVEELALEAIEYDDQGMGYEKVSCLLVLCTYVEDELQDSYQYTKGHSFNI